MATAVDINPLVQQLLPGAQIQEITPLTGGVSAQVSAVRVVTAEGVRKQIVVRQHREVEGKVGPHIRAHQEFALLQVLFARGIAVSQPRLFVPPQTLLVDLVPGTTQLPDHAEPALAAALAAIHNIQTEGLPSLELFADPGPLLGEWLPDLALERCRPFGGKLCLVHGDFWPGNVLWQEGKISAVLDWEDACLGDPLIDIANMRAELFRMVGPDSVERFTSAYESQAVIDFERLRWWDLFMATAPLRYMDGWRLPPDEIALRREKCLQWQKLALAALSPLPPRAS